MKGEHLEAAEVLEAYVLQALPPDEAEAVAGHVRECAACQGQVAELSEVVFALPEGLRGPGPDPALRARVLEAARLAARAPRGWTLRSLGALRPSPGTLRRAAPFAAAVVAAIAIVGALDSRRQLEGIRAELREYQEIAMQVSLGGRWWYMAGVGEFERSGGSLIARGDEAMVVFHDLAPVVGGRHYTVWLIAADGRWVRAANFAPAPRTVQSVALTHSVDDYVQCAVTVESSETGRRAGPLVMQSRVFEP